MSDQPRHRVRIDADGTIHNLDDEGKGTPVPDAQKVAGERAKSASAQYQCPSAQRQSPSAQPSYAKTTSTSQGTSTGSGAYKPGGCVLGFEAFAFTFLGLGLLLGPALGGIGLTISAWVAIFVAIFVGKKKGSHHE